MKRFVCCTIVSVALACLLFGLDPTNATTEDSQRVTTVQFRSKADYLELCTGYQVFPNLFVTEARCLTGQNGKINDFNEVDFTEDGLQTVEFFPMRRSEMNSSVDSVLFLKSLVRFARDDEEAGAGVTDKPVNKTSGAGTLLGNGFMIATVLMLGV
ncbi:hypothetical protein pipiens_002625 [Culex pipiens pipiens]|uniref:Uncharacterized protein n=1 Tax=Culex pipiens pipiens TaxID=38569 RepID=A0ABD1DAN0_CULPP